jgi:hypothetical protein
LNLFGYHCRCFHALIFCRFLPGVVRSINRRARAGIQKLLAGRELVPVLRACPQLDGPHQTNGNGCWYVRLQKGPGAGSPAREADAGPAAVDQGQAVETAMPHAAPLQAVEVAHVGFGLVATLTPQMRADMGCAPGYEIQTVSRLDQPTSGALILPTSVLLQDIHDEIFHAECSVYP